MTGCRSALTGHQSMDGEAWPMDGEAWPMAAGAALGPGSRCWPRIPGDFYLFN